ncbi:G patch domain-containing protein, partial [Lachnellula willkommii]
YGRDFPLVEIASYDTIMSVKRSRATFEADLQAQQSPFVAFGTPLPPLDPDVRDDGSYVPVWKQEVRDERGQKRLHGAFTGGFSAGYFNTVGSKEGWTPSTFVSSRSNRKKDAPKAPQQRPEDFMDEEDIADAAEAQRVETANGFAGLGTTQDDAARRGALIDLFRTEGETVGIKLLKKMGWKEGQGVGPKIRRKARLDGVERAGEDNNTTHLFAPEKTHMISFVKKNDHKGLGFEGETKLTPSNGPGSNTVKSDDEDDVKTNLLGPKAVNSKSKKKQAARGGIGIGILNDTGSDDEDPYEIGPRISYNRVIGGDKKKKKPANGAVNPLLKSKPVFISKKAAMAKAAIGFRKCHDGRLPLDGFTLSSSDEFSSIIQSAGEYAPPEIPKGWKSSKEPKPGSTGAYLSTADAAKASKLDPKSRAAILGEAALPGKSVFDFLSPAARDKLASASGKSNLPAALGEIPAGYAMTEEERQREFLAQIPKVDKYTADAALSRGASGFMPYSEDESKRSRYRTYLENQAGINPNLPEKAFGISKHDWLKELNEFANCAQIFKPMSGMMATRFTTSTTAPKLASDAPDSSTSLLSKPEPKPEDPAQQAAKLAHEHEVVISNRATGLNPIDYKSVDYNFCLPEFPWVTGREMAGVVEMVGAGVRDVKVGDHVWTSTYYRDRRAGCFQQYITVPAHTVLPLPPSTSFTSAASLGVAGLTAAMTLWHWLEVPFPPSSANSPLPANSEKQEQEQEFLLIWGGGTVTGQYALQLAALSHLRVIAITSSHTAPLARSLGAVVIERDNKTNTQIISEIKSIAGDNITRAIDLVGPKTASACLQVLSKSRRTLFAPLAMMGTEDEVAGNVQVVTVEMKRFVLDAENRAYALELNRLVGQGRVQVPGIEAVEGGLENVVLGLERLKKGQMGGRKMVVVF